MSGQGVYGPDGPKGPTGITGRKGLQGDGRGPTGPNLYSGGLLTVSTTTTGETLTVSESSSGTYYPLNREVGGSFTITLPATTPTIGTFWVFKNLKSNLNAILTLQNGILLRDATFASFQVTIAPNNSIIIASLGTSNNSLGGSEYVVF